jgi:hypothetical protein
MAEFRRVCALSFLLRLIQVVTGRDASTGKPTPEAEGSFAFRIFKALVKTGTSAAMITLVMFALREGKTLLFS